MTKLPSSEMLIEVQNSQKKYFSDLFQYRELFYFLARKDILVRYRQAFFGVAWALVRPLLNMAIFAFLFGKVANFPSENVNYALFVLAGMLPWQLFSSSVIDTCNSLVNNTQLISKIYFPRIIIPCAQIIVHLLDFMITACILLCLVFFSGNYFGWALLALPLFILLTLLLCLGCGLWLSALTVKYRDFRIIIPFAMQLGLFISPVGYGTFIIPAPWQLTYFLNPMVGIIDGFRWAFFGISHPYIGASIAFSIAISFGLLISGFYYFRKTERSFADKI